LRGPEIAEEFVKIVDDYVATHYKRRDDNSAAAE
jgi:hypothetical protein